MSWLRELLVRLGRGGGIDRLEGEIEEELRFHLEMKVAALEAEGLTPEAARREAGRLLGNVQGIRHDGARILAGAPLPEGGRPLAGMWYDVRMALRQLARRPAFALLTILIFALGLSASTAVFTYIQAYGDPFPGARTSDLMQVYGSSPDAPYTPLSYPDYLDLVASGAGLFEVAGERSNFAASVRLETLVDVAFGQGVTGNLFSLLGVPLQVGRGITEADDVAAAAPVVVLSHAYWLQRFGGNEGVIGSTLYLNNEPYTVVGVVAPEFVGTRASARPDFWLPFEQYKRVYWARSDFETNREAMAISPLVRVDPANRDRAGQVIEALAASLDATVPLETGTRRFLFERATWIHPAARLTEISTARIMLAAAIALLLLACANVANLVLALGTRRLQEMAMRSAIGATRRRLVRQLLTENLLLALFGGAIAVALAVPAANRIGSFFDRPSVWGANVPREVTLDGGVFLIGLGLSVAVGLLAGVIPALRASRRNIWEILRTSGSGALRDAGEARQHAGFDTRDVLVSLQIALAVMLLVVAGLVLRTLDSVRRTDPGFDVRSTVASFVSTSSVGTPPEERVRFYRDLLARYEAQPWVRAATLADAAPLSPHGQSELRIDGLAEPVTVPQAKVVPGYFETLAIPIRRGRTLLASDTAGAPDVVLVNETMVRRHFGGTDPLGRRVWLGADQSTGRAFEIVGVTADAKLTDLLAEQEPVVYFSYPQHYYTPGNALLLSTTVEPSAALPLLEQELRSINNRMALVNALPYSEVVRGFRYTQRMNAELFTVVALFGLALAAAGVFGVMSLAVGRRRREIGIRLAIGASRGEIARLIARNVSRAIVLGLAAGLAGAYAASRLVRSMLRGVEPTDPVSIIGGVAVLVGAALLAAYLPARRATRVDPLATLKVE